MLPRIHFLYSSHLSLVRKPPQVACVQNAPGSSPPTPLYYPGWVTPIKLPALAFDGMYEGGVGDAKTGHLRLGIDTIIPKLAVRCSGLPCGREGEGHATTKNLLGIEGADEYNNQPVGMLIFHAWEVQL